MKCLKLRPTTGPTNKRVYDGRLTDSKNCFKVLLITETVVIYTIRVNRINEPIPTRCACVVIHHVFQNRKSFNVLSAYLFFCHLSSANDLSPFIMLLC